MISLHACSYGRLITTLPGDIHLRSRCYFRDLKEDLASQNGEAGITVRAGIAPIGFMCLGESWGESNLKYMKPRRADRAVVCKEADCFSEERPRSRCCDFGEVTYRATGRPARIGLGDSGMSVRTVNCLETNKVATIRELAQMSQEELMKIPNFGEMTLSECIDHLDRLEVPHSEWKVVKRKRRRSRKKKN